MLHVKVPAAGTSEGAPSSEPAHQAHTQLLGFSTSVGNIILPFFRHPLFAQGLT